MSVNSTLAGMHLVIGGERLFDPRAVYDCMVKRNFRKTLFWIGI